MKKFYCPECGQQDCCGKYLYALLAIPLIFIGCLIGWKIAGII